ncbi:MAG TPA: hypothetical protein VKX45_26040 [Bryobacteraceae bacterium]|nr:hypothetical protein [Bryobacteraceae bacterium]
MKQILTIGTVMGALACYGVAAEKRVQMKDLPPAVQQAAQQEQKSAEIKGFTKETEHGVTEYEIETVRNGRHRDISLDATGKVLAVEEETSIDAIPAAAKAAILKKVGTGKLNTVETITKGTAVLYEAGYKDTAGKSREVVVKADGMETKD